MLRRLRDAGHVAYFAGGCVRDMVRNLPPKDIDIATDARPEEVQKLFPRTYAVGAHFGVIVVLENGFQFEVATFRSDDVYLDGRRPSEVHFSSPEEDARRRDFTINGMFFDPVKNEVIDFVGGRDDLHYLAFHFRVVEGFDRDRNLPSCSYIPQVALVDGDFQSIATHILDSEDRHAR